MAVVTPFGPRGQARHVQADLPEEGCPVHRVKGVAKVNFQNNVGDVAGSAVGPLLDGVDGGFTTQGDSNPDLERREGRARLLLVHLAEAFANEASESFTNRDGSDVIIAFGDGVEGSPSEMWGELWRSSPRSKKPHHVSKVCGNFIAMRRAQGLTEMALRHSRGGSSGLP